MDTAPAAGPFSDERAGASSVADLVDWARIQGLTDTLYDATAITSAIIDLDGIVLTGSGWQPICTEFHRVHPISRERCIASDTLLAERAKSAEGHSMYSCPHGLVDCVTPLIVAGNHVANVFTGQFLLGPPDLQRFREQAEELGFDENAYLAALAVVPIVKEERVKAHLRFLARFAELIGEMALAGLRQDEALHSLREAEVELRESEARYRSLFEDSPVAMWEEDHSAVKAYIEELVASGVEDVAGYLLDHPEKYERCVELARTLNINRAAVDLYGATSREQLIERAGEVDLGTSGRNIRHFWAAMAAGRRLSTHDDSTLTLTGRRIEVRETCMAAPGHEGSFDRVYIADLDVTDQNRSERRLRRTLEQLRRSVDATVMTLVRTIELRDPYTAGHQERVSRLAQAIGERLHLGRRRLTALRIAASIHDLGKMGVPAEILSKPGVLGQSEMMLIEQHPSVAFEILREVRFQGPVAEIVRAHHERLDGSGYPRGLSGDEIRIESRILAVADVVEAMSAHRPYRPALGIDAALAEIVDKRDVHYDAAVVDACVWLCREGGFTFS